MGADHLWEQDCKSNIMGMISLVAFEVGGVRLHKRWHRLVQHSKTLNVPATPRPASINPSRRGTVQLLLMLLRRSVAELLST